MKTKNKIVFLAFALTLILSGCYWNNEVATNQMGVQLNKNKIVTVVGAGVYSDSGYFSDLKVTDVDTKTFSVEDAEVLTSDNQAVGVKITIQARRKSDNESIENLFTNWTALIDNQALIDTISATAREGLKNGVRGYTLPQLLDDRNGLADAIRKQLELDSLKYGVEIANVTVENISPSVEYMGILSQTANIKAETDKELQRQTLVKQTSLTNIVESEQKVLAKKAQLLAEQAETDVQVEIAKRAGEVTKAQNVVYTDNPQAFELEKLRLLEKLFSGKTVYYIPAGTDLTGIFGLENGLIPAAK